MKIMSTRIWLALMGLTLITYASSRFGLAAGTLVITTLLIAITKAKLVADYFMNLARVGGMWRLVVTGYLLAVGGGIAGAFLG
jgi:caa(3)-type oxidase subunit IV